MSSNARRVDSLFMVRGANARYSSQVRYFHMMRRQITTNLLADYMVANYLIVCGRSEALKTFLRDSRHIMPGSFISLMFRDLDKAFNYIKIRGEVFNLIETYRAADARELIETTWPGLIEKSSQLRFLVTLQEFLDKITQVEFDAQNALVFAQQNLSEFVNGSECRENLIFEAMSILAFKNPADCPFFTLCGDKRRVDVAKMVSLILMRETERLAVIEMTGHQNVESSYVPDNELVREYMTSFQLVSHIGLVEAAQFAIANPSYIKICNYETLTTTGTPGIPESETMPQQQQEMTRRPTLTATTR